MRNILHGTTARQVFMADLGPSGGGLRGWLPFGNKPNVHQRQPQNNQQSTNQNNQQQNNTSQSSQQNNQQPNQQSNNNQQQNENSDNWENFLSNHQDLWQDKKDGNDTDDPKLEEERRKRLETQNEQLRNYINGIDFGIKVDMAKLSEAIQNNNPEYLQSVFTDAAKRVFAKTFDDVSRMITGAETRFKEYASNVAQTNVNARESELSLFETVPISRHPVFKPIAMSMKARFMKKGLSDEDANNAVQKAFKSIREADPELLGLEDENEDLTTPINGKRVTNRNSGKRGASDEIDFVALLTNQG